MIKNKFKTKRGFTLIELMVSVSIFAIVTLITSGSFIVLANIYRKVQSNRAIIDNLNLAMDTMTLQIREGENYSIGGDQFSFDEYRIVEGTTYERQRTVTYKLEGTVLQECDDLINDCTDLTSREIEISRLNFDVRGGANEGKLVTIVMKGKAKNKQGLETEFLLQTSLAQRNKRNNI
ncbi:MAG: hypothetical protein A2571_03010 [Candidatus Vogelbacteria bacterium RIFOXYD1_FULL_44_32]|uniref:Prepilin-type N-terminal cleavage/methylation domain-containing protein n=1 Tax=Candidatus Vogelbacteria bacterium RIFOXYD1_FULL_44_32 TaxID=1802438 RepID=A0A1G2QCA4_9BACT|nr:MAG: hypothetical protein A2571_03010 [Candidatus Vogelbacteria bacterium RIFOXYD1_FULL_44_32]